jgi:hypothetical protein
MAWHAVLDQALSHEEGVPVHEDQVHAAAWQVALVVLSEQSGRVPLHPPLDAHLHPAFSQVV